MKYLDECSLMKRIWEHFLLKMSCAQQEISPAARFQQLKFATRSIKFLVITCEHLLGRHMKYRMLESEFQIFLLLFLELCHVRHNIVAFMCVLDSVLLRFTIGLLLARFRSSHVDFIILCMLHILFRCATFNFVIIWYFAKKVNFRFIIFAAKSFTSTIVS